MTSQSASTLRSMIHQKILSWDSFLVGLRANSAFIQKDLFDFVTDFVEAENARLKAEVDKLREWQQIILGTGTDRESVIRMAATKYTEIAAQSWRDEVEKLKAERDFSQAKYEKQCEGTVSRIRRIQALEADLIQATQREARLREALARIANHGPMMLARGEYRRGQMDMLGGIVRIAKQAIEEAGT